MGYAQIYLVEYTDKADSPYSIYYPEAYLSDRSIIRRHKQGIPIEVSDLPVNPQYVNEVKAFEDVSLLYNTKWLNASVIVVKDSLLLENIADFPFVKAINPLKNYYKKSSSREKRKEDEYFPMGAYEPTESDYGPSYHQLNLLNLIDLHKQGLQGQGMIIAVMDGGFNDINLMGHFDSLFIARRVLAQRDYVDLDHKSVDGAWHGTHVLSCMASYQKNELIGSAPAASYLLLRTEDVNWETRLEELNWAVAAEFADSLGADILNTSLGYTDYYFSDGQKDSAMSYTWSNLDGQTSYITRASDLAARKGMLVVNSAGNSGNGSWKYIGMPADGDSVLAIGALDSLEERIGFSSFGRSEDPRVKPNVMAMGHRVVLAHRTEDGKDSIRLGSGTSFAGPILAGAAACLWQSRPDLSNMEVFQAIQESANRFSNPDTAYGYGLPDFVKAQQILNSSELSIEQIQLFPVPCAQYLMMRFFSPEAVYADLEIFDLNAKSVFHKRVVIEIGFNEINLNTSELRDGMYLLRLTGKQLSIRKTFLKDID